MAYHLYMLRCADGTLYTGITTDLERRIGEHNGVGASGRTLTGASSGAGAKYTRSRRPVELVYARRFKDRSSASIAEAALKKLSREEKLDFLEKSSYIG